MKNIQMNSWQNSTEKSERLKMWFHRQNMAVKDWSVVFITQPDSFSSLHEIWNLCSVIMNTCLHCAKKRHRNLSDMSPSTFKIGLREITIPLMCKQKFYPAIRLHVNGRNNSQHCLRADVSYFLCCIRKKDRATKEIGDVCTQATPNIVGPQCCESLRPM